MIDAAALPVYIHGMAEGCTCYLLRKLTRQVTQSYDRAVSPAGLTITQYSLLQNLRREPGMSISTLAARMGMERTSLLRTLQPVLAAGWARNEEGGAGRPAALEITQEGMKRLRVAKPMWQKAQDELRSRLGVAGLGALQASLRSSLDTLNEAA
jgi:DNA-binding MarR family transcriptional regulator